MINIVIPMAGAGSRFRAEGYDLPKPFIDVNGKMMIERVLDGVNYPNAHYTLIIQKQFEEDNKEQLEKLAKNYHVAFISVEKLTQGACCTALASHEIINNNLPVIFADSDNIFDNKAFQSFVNDCLKRKLDGSLLTFNTDEECFSYAQTDENGFVIKTREKEVISNHAITGVYMFARGADFAKCAIDMMIYGDKAKSEFYMSNVYNWAYQKGLKIGVYDIKPEDWNCVGTPEQLRIFLRKVKKMEEVRNFIFEQIKHYKHNVGEVINWKGIWLNAERNLPLQKNKIEEVRKKLIEEGILSTNINNFEVLTQKGYNTVYGTADSATLTVEDIKKTREDYTKLNIALTEFWKNNPSSEGCEALYRHIREHTEKMSATLRKLGVNIVLDHKE